MVQAQLQIIGSQPRLIEGGNPAPPWSPLALPWGYYSEARAATVALEPSTTRVAAWLNEKASAAGSLAQSLAGNQPSFVDDGSGPGGQPFIAFSGAGGNDILTCPDHASLKPAPDDGWHVAAVLRITGTALYSCPWIRTSGTAWGDGAGMYNNNGVRSHVSWVGSYTAGTSGAANLPAGWHILHCRYDRAKVSVFLDGAVLNEAAYAVAITWAAGTVLCLMGQEVSGTLYYPTTGDVAAFGAGPKLSDADMAQLNARWSSKYGIPVS